MAPFRVQLQAEELHARLQIQELLAFPHNLTFCLMCDFLALNLIYSLVEVYLHNIHWRLVLQHNSEIALIMFQAQIHP